MAMLRRLHALGAKPDPAAQLLRTLSSRSTARSTPDSNGESATPTIAQLSISSLGAIGPTGSISRRNFYSPNRGLSGIASSGPGAWKSAAEIKGSGVGVGGQGARSLAAVADPTAQR